MSPNYIIFIYFLPMLLLSKPGFGGCPPPPMAMYWRVKRIPANAVVGTTKTHIGVLENVTSKSTSHEHRLIRTLTEWTRPQLWTTRTKTTRKQRYCFGGVLGCVYSTTDTRPTHAVKSSILHSIANPLGPNPLWALRNNVTSQTKYRGLVWRGHGMQHK